MKTRLLLLLLPLLICGACTSTGGAVAQPDRLKNETDDQFARRMIGDVRVYYYIKPGMVLSARFKESGTKVKQKEFHRVLINKGHSFYIGIGDANLKEEEFFLEDTAMYDLLLVLKSKGFFDRGSSVNIGSDDPVERAKREPGTHRIVAVEQIKKSTNVSYFAWRYKEDELDIERARTFNEVQRSVMWAIRNALPHGVAGIGKGPDLNIHR